MGASGGARRYDYACPDSDIPEVEWTMSFLCAIALLIAVSTSGQGTPPPGASTAGQGDEAAVREAYEAYKNAILDGRGAEAVRYLNRASIAFYGEMKALALRAPESEVRRLPVMNKVTVLLLRHRVAPDVLEKMSPEEIVVYGVDRGWIGRDAVENSDIGDVRVNGDVATAEYVMGGQRTPISYRFTREDGVWKFDFTALLPVVDGALRELLKRERMDEDKFVLGLLEQVSGEKPARSIWKPLKRGN
jgi:hypothetical protein